MKPFLRNFLTAATIAGAASAQVPGVDGLVLPPPAVVFSEIVINPPGTDEGFESIELTGTPGLPLSGWWILAIEGDGTTAGLVDVRISLGAYVLGANGVLLLRDAATDFGQGFNSAVSTVYLPVVPKPRMYVFVPFSMSGVKLNVTREWDEHVHPRLRDAARSGGRSGHEQRRRTRRGRPRGVHGRRRGHVD